VLNVSTLLLPRNIAELLEIDLNQESSTFDLQYPRAG
jgi:hypothetical protein